MLFTKFEHPVRVARTAPRWFRWTVAACLALAVLAPGARALDAPEDAIGSGDGRIHIIPTLSAPSVKNGELLGVQAIVTAEAGVASVEAVIEREGSPALVKGGMKELLGLPAARFTLAPAPVNLGGVNELGTLGLWQAEWTAHGLEEAWYRVTITVTDRDGHRYSDASLRFSDPIAGNDAIGDIDYPNGGMRRMDSGGMQFPEHGLRSAVIDPSSGHAWFGTITSPGHVVKVTLGSGGAPPVRVGAVTLEPGETNLQTAVIDLAGGHAYFGTSTSPGRVVKVALGAGSDPPSRVGAATLETGEDQLLSSVIDPAGGHAYFGTQTTPGHVVKVALGAGSDPPSRVGAVTLEPGENNLVSAVIDPAGGHAYFGTQTSPGRVVKVALGSGSAPPVRVGAVTLESGENSPRSAVMDLGGGHAYFGTASTPGRVVKVALGAGSDPPSRVGAEILDTGENRLYSAVIDPAGGHAYFGTDTVPGRVIKVALGAGGTPPSRVGAEILESGENWLYSAVIDPAGGHAYFGASTTPGRVVKVALGAGSAPPVRAGAETLKLGENQNSSAVIDPSTGHAYFGTSTAPGHVVKVALGSGGTPPVRVGAVTLEPGENNLVSAVIDPAGGHAYFGTQTSPGRVVKVALGAGSDPPVRVGAATLEAGENSFRSAVIDPAGGHAYFGTGTIPAHVVKVALGAGSAPPARVGAEILEPGENQIRSAVIDPGGGHAYFGTFTSPGRVVKVALGTGSAPPSRVGAEILETGENFLNAAVIDPAGGHAYFGTSTNPGRVVKVALGAGGSPPVRVGAEILEAGENNLLSAVIDPANGHAYFGTFTTPGRVVRVALSQRDFVKATRLTLPETGVVTDVRFYSHEDTGNLRLGLYSDAADPVLLWESGVIANTAEEDWVNAPIGGGTPSSLMLPPGDYWLAWQVDTTASVPSYAAGAAGEGFVVPHVFGGFPALLEAGTATEPEFTDEIWSAYVVYEAPPNAVTITPTTTGPTNATSIDFTVEFDKPVENFEDASDLVITHSGTAHTGVAFDGGPEVYTVTVEGISGDGSFTLAVSTASDVQDLTGNALASSVTSAPVVIDNTAPVFSDLLAEPSMAAEGDEVVITFASSEPIAGAPDVLVNGNPADAALKSPFAYVYTVSALDPLGPATIQISGVDAAGNAALLEDSASLVIVESAAGLPAAAPALAALALLGAAALLFRVRPRRREM